LNTETNLSALLRGIDHSNRLEVVLLPLRGSEESITLIG